MNHLEFWRHVDIVELALVRHLLEIKGIYIQAISRSTGLTVGALTAGVVADDLVFSCPRFW